MSKLGMVVLNYNDYKTTIKFINMIKYYNNIDSVIIVDNNSNDNSVEEIKKHLCSNMILIESNENRGYGAGNNIGIQYLRDNTDVKYVAICNPDIEFEEDAINKIIKYLDSDTNIALASGEILENGVRPLDSSWKLPSYYQCLLQTIPIIDKLVNRSMAYSTNDYNKEISFVEVLKGCFFIARLDVLTKINDFSNETFLYYEENILCKKIKDIGYSIAVLNNIKIIHAHGVTINKNVNKINRYKILDNSRRIYLKECLKCSSFKLKLYDILKIISINLRGILFKLQYLIKSNK